MKAVLLAGILAVVAGGCSLMLELGNGPELVALDPPTVTISSPTKAQPVPVNGKAKPGVTIALYEGSSHVGQAVIADALGAWSTTLTLVEGQHDLTATATDDKGRVSIPTAVTVIVDRTAPTITSRVPAPGSVNVWSRDAIVATFSEELNTATLADATVQFVCTRQDQTPVTMTKSLTFTKDAKTDVWALSVKPLSLPPVPSTCVIALSNALTDLAGNALTVPADSWSWKLPDWQDLGILVDATSKWHMSNFHVAIRGDGTPVVAFGGTPTTVLAWSPGTATWSHLSGLTAPGFPDSVPLVEDNTGLLWAGFSGTTGAWAASWDGSAWSTPNALDFGASQGAYDEAMIIDSSGMPVVAWAENSGTVRRVYVRRWSGTQWELLSSDAISSDVTTASGVSVGLDASGQVVVSWINTDTTSGTRSFSCSTCTGPSWVCSSTCGGQLHGVTGGKIRVPPVGKTFVGWIDTTVTPNLAKVWNYASNYFTPFGADASLNVDATKGVGNFDFALDASGAPVFAWTESTSSGRVAVYVKRWTGTAWELLGGDVSALTVSSPYAVAIGLGKEGLVAIAWEAQGSPSEPHRLYARRYNR